MDTPSLEVLVDRTAENARWWVQESGVPSVDKDMAEEITVQPVLSAAEIFSTDQRRFSPQIKNTAWLWV